LLKTPTLDACRTRNFAVTVDSGAGRLLRRPPPQQFDTGVIYHTRFLCLFARPQEPNRRQENTGTAGESAVTRSSAEIRRFSGEFARTG
jgi:hypothetical protein